LRLKTRTLGVYYENLKTSCIVSFWSQINTNPEFKLSCFGDSDDFAFIGIVDEISISSYTKFLDGSTVLKSGRCKDGMPHVL
jgi:hypothetical protein